MPLARRDNPFPGLRSFEFADRSFFFGRDLQILELYHKLRNHRFVAVVGGSGSGKSSLVKAGLGGRLFDDSRREASDSRWRGISDPVGSGFVASFARPGGNMTGFTIFPTTITGKYLAMLKEMMPQLARVAIIYNADYTRSFFLSPLVGAARELKVQPITAQVRNPAEIESAIAKLGSEPRSGLIVMPENFTSVHRQLIISLAAQFRIPTIYPYRYFADEGGLLSYGVDISDLFRRAAEYVSRILRGAKPADLPVQAPTKFELVINLKTARALGLAVPRILLAGADATIE